MPRISYEDYETEVYVTVSPEWDEDIDNIYHSCSTEEIERFMELATTDGHEPDGSNREVSRNTDDDHDESELEKTIATLMKFSTEDINALPDELIDEVNKHFTVPTESSTKTIKPTVLDEVKLLSQLVSAQHPQDSVMTELNLLIANL